MKIRDSHHHPYFCNCDINKDFPSWGNITFKYERLIVRTIEQYNFGRTLLFEDILSALIEKLIKLDKESRQKMYENYNYTEAVINNFCRTIYRKEKERRNPAIILKIARAGRILDTRAEDDFISSMDINIPVYMGLLTDKERAVVKLWRNGLSHKEIALQLHITVDSSKKRLQRAKQRIAKLFI